MRRLFFHRQYGREELRPVWSIVIVSTLVLAGVGAMAVAFAFITAPMYIVACDNAWQDFIHEWHFFGGCLVQLDGVWYPDDAARVILAR